MCVHMSLSSIELSSPPPGTLIQFVNCRVLQGNTFTDQHIWMMDGKILSPTDVFYERKTKAHYRVDCEGRILSAGFIDIQLNGGFGVDFSSPSLDISDVSMVRRRLLEHGVTSFAPTLITSQPKLYKRNLALFARRHGDDLGAGILGAHVEGPFISSQKRGCHPEQFVRGEAGPTAIDEVYGSCEHIAIATVAPELPGALDMISELDRRGVVVSLGHSSADLAHGEAGVRAGGKALTHLYNAMQSYHHRDPGLIGLLASHQQLFYGIIADGIHTHDSALKIAYSTHPSGLVLVTDAIAALGMGDGAHRLGAQQVHVKGLLATLDGTTTTAGSVAPMPLCIRHLVHAAGCSLEEALLSATAKPAALLGVCSEVGDVRAGSRADLVLLDDDVSVRATFIAGRRVFLSSDRTVC